MELITQSLTLLISLVHNILYVFELTAAKGENGNGFSIGWNKHSNIFAVAQQSPGKVAVWNYDTKEVIAVITLYPFYLFSIQLIQSVL
jgi:hypothetical protein